MGNRFVVGSAVVAVVIGVTGCGASQRAAGPSAATTSAPTSAATSTSAAVTPSTSAASQPLPADFPKGIPLPSAPLLGASGRATPDGAGLWLLTYGGSDPDAIARSEGAALKRAGFDVTGEPVHATRYDDKRGLTTIDVMTDGTHVSMTVDLMAPLDLPTLG